MPKLAEHDMIRNVSQFRDTTRCVKSNIGLVANIKLNCVGYVCINFMALREFTDRNERELNIPHNSCMKAGSKCFTRTYKSTWIQKLKLVFWLA